jgi:two-component system KDP operon response regulator KdpE
MKYKGKRILIVDDEARLLRVLQRNLKANGYDVFGAESGEEALEQMNLHQPDLILLDLRMPQAAIDGLEFCKRIREVTRTPIIILSAVSEEKEKVRALDLGADDYLTKPFSNDELQARVRACLRRSQVYERVVSQEPEILASGDGYLYVDIPRRIVRINNQEIRLTRTEFDLLQQLMLHSGKVLTHRVLLRAVWGPEYGEEADYLRVYVRQLRRKVEAEPSRPQYIQTEPGIGYVFRANVEISYSGIEENI